MLIITLPRLQIKNKFSVCLSQLVALKRLHFLSFLNCKNQLKGQRSDTPALEIGVQDSYDSCRVPQRLSRETQSVGIRVVQSFVQRLRLSPPLSPFHTRTQNLQQAKDGSQFNVHSSLTRCKKHNKPGTEKYIIQMLILII